MHLGNLEIHRFRTNLRRVYLAAILLFTRPEPVLFTVGAALVLSGVLFHFWAAGYLTRGKSLVVSGPYCLVRNPFYTAAILIDLGFGLASRNFIALAAFLPIIALVYLTRVKKEEQDLRASFGDDYQRYCDYCPRRFVPCWTNLFKTSGLTAIPFSLGQVARNREWGRAASHISILLLVGLPLLWAVPWTWVSLPVRGVALAALAVLLAVVNVRKAAA